MRELSLKLKHKELYILLLLGASFVVFLQFLLGIPGLIRIAFLVVVVLIGVLLLFESTIKWRLLSYFFFVWLILEGIFRKWILPDFSTPLFFIKHLLLLGPYFYILTKGVKIPKKHYPFLGLLLAYVLWGVMEAINFRATTDFRVHLLGLITHFWFVPLIFLLPMIFNTEEKILKLFKIMVYISLPIFILGTIQYFSPYSSFVNKYAREDVGVAYVGDYVRITGVFSYMSPYKAYILVVLIVNLYLLVIRSLSKLEMLILPVVLALGMVNLIMIGSRHGVVLFLIKSSLFIMYYLFLKGRLRIRKKAVVRFMFIIPFLFYIMFVTDIGQKSLSSLTERVRNTQYDVIPRLKGAFTPFKFLPESGLAGYGIGTAYQGAFGLVQDWGDMPRAFEEEWERILLELGLIGFVILVLLRLYILFYSWKVFRRIQSYELKFIALMAILNQLPILFGGNIVFNYFENIIYWFSIGLLIAVHRMDTNNVVNATKGFSITPR